MGRFQLSPKNIPDVNLFHKAIKAIVPEFDGLEIENDIVVVELLTEITQDLIDKIEAIIPPNKPLADVSPRQFRQALILSNLSPVDIDNAINTLPEPQRSLAKIEWEFSVSYQRARPLVSQIAQILGKTNAEVDTIWELALTL